jgi:hypothetical protein
VIAHGKHLLLREPVEALSLRDDVTDELMVLLDRSLLPGLVRITVVHACTNYSIIIQFDEMRVLKLGPVV